ncbi:hypothetical protein F441_08468 [Phytophthora nicotianae CJ01A1]|uniref:Uncharacterized protein n=5 Tax=Phytophthora nicotianae TaxID=4792 RepID=V9F6X4_PHYNI|nr:hypothetical protein F443_08487 [Phytophthora nicotianae P1569]ETK87182.1 hypothetical protein L915_08325 [Phytophthora nicotianae]ETL40604.1 hypothetical protein L916_08251 [Phytophthora nicotianae]ETO75958.1 hypothetical protein F444_08553 [Phytophthora nicotianae P1976]ETP17055.1 hypothetical protein F441_08468 [Phytophthora nicotianae CJ01A1]
MTNVSKFTVKKTARRKIRAVPHVPGSCLPPIATRESLIGIDFQRKSLTIPSTMEYLSNPNNQDTLPSEILQQAHEESEAQTYSPEASELAGTRRDDESELARSRKKQKVDWGDYQVQIDKLQQEIAEVKERLASPQHESSSAAYELGKRCIEAKQTATTMKRKLAEHAHWLQRVSSLMETAPLFDFAVSRGDQKETNLQRSMDALAGWRGETKERPHPRLKLDERLRAAVAICQENALKLLRDAAEGSPSFQLSLQFESHGWEIATGTLINDHIGFTCHRVLPSAMAKDVAMALWNSLERDEIFRTFVPLVQDSIITHQETNCSLLCRMLVLSQEMNQQAVATVEAISATHDEDGPWQISMEAVHDHYLCTFAAEAAGDAVIQNSSPPMKLDLGLQMSKLNMHNNFVMGARVVKTDEGVDVFIAGSARFDLPCYHDPTFNLLQHFVSHMPVYEDLHLTALGEAALDVS